LRTVAMGGSYLSPELRARRLQRSRRSDPEFAPAVVLGELSPRQWSVLRLVADGKSSKEIALLLGLRLHTVLSYRKTMMKRFRVNNVAGLTQVAILTGISKSFGPAHNVCDGWRASPDSGETQSRQRAHI
jgi:DNA-binding NarL/FixJ family response regulator